MLPPPVSSGILDGKHTLYVDPDANAADWVRDHPSDPRASRIATSVADVAMARWFDEWDGKVRDGVDEYVSAATDAGKVPVLVGYNIVYRDCGQYSAGGASSPDQYRQWARDFAAGIGSRPALVVLEPDSLIHLQPPSCLDESGKRTRLSLLSYAVTQLAQHAPNALVYLDGGDGRFSTPEQLAPRLVAAGVARARGFSVNVSNFNTTQDAQDFALRLQGLLADDYQLKVGFVIDTSRNGNGSDGQWCNPAGRRIGATPILGGVAPADARLWVKKPGESDGDCGIAKGSHSGTFLPELAMTLING